MILRPQTNTLTVVLVSFLAFAAWACAPAQSGPPADPEIVATYRGGTITKTDVDRAVLEMPTAQRRLPAEDPNRWYAGLVERLIVDRLMLDLAEREGAETNPAFVKHRETSRKSLVVNRYLELHLPPGEPIGEDGLRHYYEEHLDQFQQPERRAVYNLFRRLTPGNSIEELEAEVGGYRQEILEGAVFSQLAEEHSDSESRHYDGLLGWVTRGQLAPQLEEVIFSLDPGVPSKAITTRDGVHLFSVAEVMRERTISFNQAREIIRRRIEGELREEQAGRLVEELPTTPDRFIPGQEELQAILTTADPEVTVLRVGDFELSLAEFREIVSAARRSGMTGTDPEIASQVLQAIERRERIYRYAVTQGLDQDPEIEIRLAELRDRDLVTFYRQAELQKRLENDTERVQAYYEQNKMRFSSPPRVWIRTLSIPYSDRTDSVAIMERLEFAKPALDDGTLSLENLADEFGGRVDDQGWQSMAQLQLDHPALMRFAPQLESGKHSPPYNRGSALELFQVAGRTEPEALPLSEVLDQVIQSCLENQGQSLYHEWAREILAGGNPQIFVDRLGSEADSVGEAPLVE